MTDFSNVNAQKIDWVDSHFNDANFNQAKLEGHIFSVYLCNTDLTDATITFSNILNLIIPRNAQIRGLSLFNTGNENVRIGEVTEIQFVPESAFSSTGELIDALNELNNQLLEPVRQSNFELYYHHLFFGLAHFLARKCYHHTNVSIAERLALLNAVMSHQIFAKCFATLIS